MAIKKGFSLIEISIAMAILSLLVVGTLGSFNQGFLYLKSSREKSAAYLLAQEVAERYSSWTNIPANGNYTNPSPYPVTLNRVIYNVTLTVSDGPVLPAELKQVGVRVAWGRQSYSLTTLKANY